MPFYSHPIGRGAAAPEDRRDKRISFSVSQEERDLLLGSALGVGMSLAGYCREAALWTASMAVPSEGRVLVLPLTVGEVEALAWFAAGLGVREDELARRLLFGSSVGFRLRQRLEALHQEARTYPDPSELVAVAFALAVGDHLRRLLAQGTPQSPALIAFQVLEQIDPGRHALSTRIRSRVLDGLLGGAP